MSHKTKQQQRVEKRNPVSKYSRRFNLAHTFTDRKQKAKKGHIKHKGVRYED